MMSSPITVRAGMTLRVPPVVPGSFLLGSARELRRDMLGVCEQAFHQHGDVVRFLIGPPRLRLELYLLSHPDAAQRVLASSWRNYRKRIPHPRRDRRAACTLGRSPAPGVLGRARALRS